MSKIEPDTLFEVWSPDQVAECMVGVPVPLQQSLWELVRHYDDKPRSEIPDDFGSRCLANWWDELKTDDQLLLNELARAETDE